MHLLLIAMPLVTSSFLLLVTYYIYIYPKDQVRQFGRN